MVTPPAGGAPRARPPRFASALGRSLPHGESVAHAGEALVLGKALDPHRGGQAFAKLPEHGRLLVLRAVGPQWSADDQADHGVAAQERLQRTYHAIC